MSPPLRERLRWSASADSELAVDTAVMARVFAYFFFIGGVIAIIIALIPTPEEVYEPGLIIPGLIAIGGAVAFIVVFDRLPVWVFHVMLPVAVVLVAVGIHSGAWIVGTALGTMYFWSAITAFGLFPRSAAIAHTGFIGLAYAVVLMVGPEPMAGLIHWLLLMSSILVAGLVIGMLRSRHEMLLARLGRDARTDALTGLMNRRGFEERFDMELERANRQGRPLAVIAVDLDHFKRVNDSLGHQAGDEALQILARALQLSTRRIDLVARIGGEEFAVVAPDTRADLGYALAERIRMDIARAFKGSRFGSLTASCGVSVYPSDGDRAELLLHAADVALYSAKEAGRNRTVVRGDALSAA